MLPVLIFFLFLLYLGVGGYTPICHTTSVPRDGGVYFMKLLRNPGIEKNVLKVLLE